MIQAPAAEVPSFLVYKALHRGHRGHMVHRVQAVPALHLGLAVGNVPSLAKRPCGTSRHIRGS